MMVVLLAMTAAAAGFDRHAGAKTADRPATNKAGAPVLSAEGEKLFARSGLFGTWAVQCKARPTPANPHVSISNPSAGLVLEDQDFGAGTSVNRYTVTAAEALSPTRLAVEVIFRPGKTDEERQRLIYEIRGDTRRTLYNRTAGGAVRVKEGIVLAAGKRTPVLKKCR
jgi:hypothetical protein